MKAITIKQPFASLIAAGIKEYEFRTWNTKYRGDILIHAGKGIDSEAMKKYAHYGLEYPAGCLIAKAYLKDIIELNEDFKKTLKKENKDVYSWAINYKEGYAFKLENIQKIKPIIIKGQLGIWNYEGDDFNE